MPEAPRAAAERQRTSRTKTLSLPTRRMPDTAITMRLQAASLAWLLHRDNRDLRRRLLDLLCRLAEVDA